MSGMYSRKRHGDTEDDDIERCFPPNHYSRASLQPSRVPAETRFGKGGQNRSEGKLHYSPDSRQNDTAEPVKELKQDSNKERNKVPAGSVVGSDGDLHFEENVPASRGTMPRTPRNAIQPGAFHADGRNARDAPGHDDDWRGIAEVPSTNRQSELDLVSAEAVDPDETNRIVERELAERQRKAPVAEVVEGFWCSKRVKRISIAVSLFIVTAVVLGTVLPRVLEPPEPTPTPTAAPTPALPYLTGFLSSISSDEGEALQTESTPQNEALNWLVNNTNLDTYPLEKKVQRYVLATLYYSTNGNNWKRNTLWLSDDDECGWYNEAKSSFCVDSAVVDLDLYDGTNGNNLDGTIPNEIGLLSNSIEEINLADNMLTGTIPSEIGGLSKLVELSLGNNSLTGMLPSEIGLMSFMIWFNLRVNGLVGTIVSEIGLLTNLQALSLSGNKLKGTIPSEIGLLTNMNSLFLSANGLTGKIPSEINLLTELNDLSLYDNALTGDYTCPDYVTFCRVSCTNETDTCRSLQVETPVPSSNAPIVGTMVPSTLVPSLNPLSTPPSVVDTDFLTVMPTSQPMPTLGPTRVSSTVQTDPPTGSPTSRPTPAPTESDPQTEPPTQRPTQAPSPTKTGPLTEMPTPQPDPPTDAPTLQPEPPSTVCGDGMIDRPEEECEPETGCPDGQSCDKIDCKCVGCGNGRLDEGEECDYTADPMGCDGGDFCNGECECYGGCLDRGAEVVTCCGDRIVNDGEECEPGEPPGCPDGQVCGNDCLCAQVPSSTQTDPPTAPPTRVPTSPPLMTQTEPPTKLPTNTCGNGIIDPEEECEPEKPNCPDGQYCSDDCTCKGARGAA